MKLLLIDDHVLFREGLSLLISSRSLPGGLVQHVLQASSLDEAEAACRLHPDVGLALLDLGLAQHQGLETLLRWRERCPQVPVVVLSADDRAETILDAIDAGASGFIPKTAQAQVMKDALDLVVDGGVFLPELPSLQAPIAGDAFGFSGRQVDVLRLLIEGQSNKEMCRRLDLSESTIKTHLAAIFRKLNVKSRTQAVVAVAQAGWNLARLHRD